MTLQTAIETAKAKTTDPKWLRAIDRAAAGLLSGEICVTLFADSTALVTTPNASYRVNGACHCKAAQNGHGQCYHRAAKRLTEMIEETAPAAVSLADDVAVSPRKNLIIEIENTWPATWPPIYRELLARFGKSHLHMLDDDQLRRVRLAIAM